MTTSNELEATSADTFRILLATDTHLGYAENDSERGNDSFNTFEEILQIAKSQQVDFILLAGDLFHDNKPSTNCLHKCMALLREYCMGDTPVSVEFLSDQNVNFQHCTQPIVNYEDPNLNISIPVYSIHGNHDDPSGQSQLSTLDLLSTIGLVNYFGKWTDLKEVKICPVLLKKGKSRLALYGLSHIKDERLSRLFRDNQVHIYRPSEYTDDWFNIFVCHQNRAERGVNRHLPEEALPAFIDLIVWGHEHECRLVEEWNASQGFYVTQPGSSVATSLCEGEAKKKYIGLLEICEKKFKLQPIKLQTVRPFIFQTLKISECTLPISESTTKSVEMYLDIRIRTWLKEACDQYTGHKRQPRLPLLRIRVEYNDEAQCFNPIRFGQKYLSDVANPNDMILLKREKKIERKLKTNDEEEKGNMEEFLQNEEIADIWEIKMNFLMKKYFDEVANKKLQVFSVKGISDAAARFIDKSDRDCIRIITEHQMKKIRDHLCKTKVNIDKIDEEIANYMHRRVHNEGDADAEESMDIMDVYKNETNVLEIENGDGERNDQNDIDEDVVVPAKGRNRGRGSRGGAGRAVNRVPRATTSRARGRARSIQISSRGSVFEQLKATSTRNGGQRNSTSKLQFQDSDEDG